MAKACDGCNQIIDDVIEDAADGIKQSMDFVCPVCGLEYTAKELNELMEEGVLKNRAEDLAQWPGQGQ